MNHHTNEATHSDLSNFPHSYWREYSLPEFSSLSQDKETQVGVIGGGIVGIISAYLLAKEGKNVVLLEAGKLLDGVTGHTTAKITAQHGLIYDELLNSLGKEKARLYYEANTEGLDFIKDTMHELDMDCDFETKEAVVYAETDAGVKQIEKEAKAYAELGIDGVLSKGNLQDLPFEVKAALSLRYQGQFHPLKFLKPLIEAFIGMGGEIYEHTRAQKLLKDETVVHTDQGTTLSCEKVIVATHYPFNDFNGLYFSKLSISRSYGLAAKVAGQIPENMYISVESPTRSLRPIRNDQGEPMLLIGGESHQTGKSDTPTQEHYTNLESFGKEYFGLESTPYHWSAQDLTTLDKVPYVGQMTSSSKDILVATGFNKWGMANGAIAAVLLTDLILGQENVYTELFDPTRRKLKAKDIQKFTWKNTSVGKDFVVGHLKRSSRTPDELKNDEGGLVSVKGRKLGGYRDPSGKLHLVKTNCTHMGCGLSWNDGERSWDCACHGSRFSYTGDVLNGPAVSPLKRIHEDK